jgi:penicillin amidase
MTLLLAALLACKPDPDAPPAVDPLAEIPLTATWAQPGLRCDVEVVRTEANVPHVYAHDDVDAARAVGFLYARDRFFFLDAARRLAAGRLSGLLGDLALNGDVGARLDGMADVAAAMDSTLDPRLAELLQAYADGVNTYIELARAGALPAPAEFDLAYGLLGAAAPMDLAEPFTRADVAAVLTTIVYQLSFDTTDLSRSAAAVAVDEGLWPPETPDLPARNALAVGLLTASRPILDTASVPASARGARRAGAPHLDLPAGLISRAAAGQEALSRRLGRDPSAPRGSNAWAVAGDRTADGRALLAGDGHLPLSVPSLFWQLGVDTALRGGGDTHELGLGLPGLPYIGVGTNGGVAWSLTRLRSDTTDWYREQLVLADGLPVAATFRGAEVPLVQAVHTVAVRAVPLLGSVARTETFIAYATADGRRIVDVEGELLEAPDDRPYVRTGDGYVVPGDTDGDGEITAISFDWAGLDPLGLLRAFDGFGHAADLAAFREATAWLNGYAQNTVAADANGDVLYTSFGALPCRADLRAEAGGWAPSGDPLFLLDGTQFGGFTIPTDAELRVLDGDHDGACSVPAADQPHALSPAEGFVANANQDPAGLSFDNDLSDGLYVGGPWDVGQRGRRIDERLTALVADGTADVAAMAALQADHEAAWARLLLPALLQALRDAATATGDTADGARLAAAWAADPRLADAEARLAAWADRGFVARSGVDTPWHTTDAAEIEDSVATMLYHAWQGRFEGRILDDEGLPDALWSPSRSDGTMRLVVDMVRADVPALDADPDLLPGAASAVFADDLATPDVRETWHEQAVLALTAALDHLASPSTGPGEGGFGTDDPTAWRWGLRHQVLFNSVLTDFLGDNPVLTALTSGLAITPATLPMGGELDRLPGFPRDGADDSVDQAGAGFETDHWRYTHGPVFRMVIALGPGGVSGLNVLPGGQSALPDDPHFADQARLWLANEALPLRFSVEDVVAGATGRELLEGADDCR